MFVNNLMLPKEKLITVTPKDTVKKALDLMESNGFLSIPVSNGDKFYGSISKEMIYTFYYEKCPDKKFILEDIQVEKIMRTDVATIHPLKQIENAAYFLATKNIAFVAVVDEYDKFIGIVPHYAIFHQFTELFGLNQGKRLAVIAYDIQGQISRLAKLITENNGDIISFVVVDPKSLTEVKEIVVRIKASDEVFKVIKEKVKENGFKIQ